MIVTFSKFEIKEDKALGANLSFYELSNLLEKQKIKGIKFIPHKIEDLILGKVKLPNLKENDVLICTISSLAWFYYYLREKEKKNFRIIHYEVTALFSDNFLQEQLCSKYMRKGDKAIFISEYQRKLSIKLFPHLNEENTEVCMPMFIQDFPKIHKKQKNQNELILGFIGNVSREKNFEQVIDVFVEVAKRLDIKVKMLVCGPAEENYMPKKIKEKLKERGIDPKNYIHVNNGKRLPYNKLGKIWEKIDVFLFPSVCGEPLGRVVLEANKLGIPVIAANHAAMPELLPKENLVSVECYDKKFNSHKLQSIGKINVNEMVEKCCNYKKLKLSDSYKRYEKDAENLIKIIKRDNISKKSKLDDSVKEFIQNFSLFLSGSFNTTTEQLTEKAVNFLQDYISKNKFKIIETKTKLCETLDYFPHFTIKQTKRLLIVSPHMDDAILSCSGIILNRKQQGDKILVLTVFSKQPSKVNSFAKEMMAQMDIKRDYNTSRKEEDLKIFKKYGIQSQHLDLIDGMFFSNSMEELFGGKTREINIDQLYTKIEEFKPDEVYLPAGIGDHIDHIAISEFSKELLSKRLKIFFYEDFPYSLSKKKTEERLDSLKKEFLLKQRVVDITDNIKEKIEMIKLYKSQLNFLFKSTKEMENTVMNYNFHLGRNYEIFWGLIEKKPTPKLIEIETTRRCNLNCNMCYNRNQPKEGIEDNLTTNDIKNFIAQSKGLGAEVISLGGGEPFLRKDIFELIKCIKKNDMRSVVFTNGLLINKETAQKIINSNLSQIYFSIDAATPDLQDYLRAKKGSFEKSINAIKQLIALRKKSKSNLKIYFGSILMGINLHQIKELINLGEKIGIDGIAFKPVRIHECEIEDNKPVIKLKTNLKDIDKLWVSPKQYDLLNEVIDYLIDYKEKNPSFIIDTKNYLSLLKNYYKTPLNKDLNLKCNASEYSVVLDKDGNLRCCWGMRWDEYIGNIKQDNLTDIWNSSRFRKMREKMRGCNLPCFNLLVGQTYLR